MNGQGSGFVHLAGQGGRTSSNQAFFNAQQLGAMANSGGGMQQKAPDSDAETDILLMQALGSVLAAAGGLLDCSAGDGAAASAAARGPAQDSSLAWQSLLDTCGASQELLDSSTAPQQHQLQPPQARQPYQQQQQQQPFSCQHQQPYDCQHQQQQYLQQEQEQCQQQQYQHQQCQQHWQPAALSAACDSTTVSPGMSCCTHNSLMGPLASMCSALGQQQEQQQQQQHWQQQSAWTPPQSASGPVAVTQCNPNSLRMGSCQGPGAAAAAAAAPPASLHDRSRIPGDPQSSISSLLSLLCGDSNSSHWQSISGAAAGQHPQLPSSAGLNSVLAACISGQQLHPAAPAADAGMLAGPPLAAAPPPLLPPKQPPLQLQHQGSMAPGCAGNLNLPSPAAASSGAASLGPWDGFSGGSSSAAAASRQLNSPPSSADFSYGAAAAAAGCTAAAAAAAAAPAAGRRKCGRPPADRSAAAVGERGRTMPGAAGVYDAPSRAFGCSSSRPSKAPKTLKGPQQTFQSLRDQIESLTAANKALQQQLRAMSASKNELLGSITELTNKWQRTVAQNQQLQRETLEAQQELMKVKQLTLQQQGQLLSLQQAAQPFGGGCSW